MSHQARGHHAHRLATHGQPEHERQRVIDQWSRHLLDAEAAGETQTTRALSIAFACASHVWSRLWNGEVTVIPLSIVIALGAGAELLFAADNDPPLTNFFELIFGLSLGAVALLLLVRPLHLHPRLLSTGMACAGIAALLVAPGVSETDRGRPLIVGGCLLFGLGTISAALILRVYERTQIPSWWWFPLRISALGALAIGLTNSVRVTDSHHGITGAVGTVLAAFAGVWGVLAVARFGLLSMSPSESDPYRNSSGVSPNTGPMGE